ncbi:MAG: hypothetical protein ABJB47_14160 [Actinomycetota bacterium]
MRSQGALADAAQAMHCLDHYPARPSQRLVEPGQLGAAAYEQVRACQQASQPGRTGISVTGAKASGGSTVICPAWFWMFTA